MYSNDKSLSINSTWNLCQWVFSYIFLISCTVLLMWTHFLWLTDYDAIVTEAGDYTTKYTATLELFRARHPLLDHPQPPPLTTRHLALKLQLSQELPWAQLVSQLVSALFYVFIYNIKQIIGLTIVYQRFINIQIYLLFQYQKCNGFYSSKLFISFVKITTV